MLEDISLSLNRPRNKVRTSEGSKALLELFVSLASKALYEDQQRLEVERGGFLRQSNQGSYRPHSRTPYTVSVAIPGRELSSQPKLLGGGRVPAESVWSEHDRWAWLLASRADTYSAGIPAFDSETLEHSRTALYQNWTIHSAENGLSFVRRTIFQPSDQDRSNQDNGFWMAAGTRYLDLAILARRSNNYTSEISSQLRNMSFSSGELDLLQTDAPLDQEDIDKVNNELQKSLWRFEQLQMDFVYLRDHLWYETVPGRPVDSQILASILDQTGARAQYEDVVNEIELRKDVYNTRTDNARIHVGRLTAERDQKEQAMRERQNTMLAFVGLAFAVPGLIQLWPQGSSPTHFFIGLVFINLIVFFGYVAVFPKGRISKSSSNVSRETGR